MVNIETYTSGHREKDGTGYTYFVPSLINDQWTWDDPAITTLLERAAIRLGELNSYARLVPSIEMFIQLHVTKEAVVSSRIEGTQTNMDEAMLDEHEVDPERRNDWKEVRNYVAALNGAIAELAHLPISSRLLRVTHRRLLSDVRGEHKLPGEFRSSQNWIGGRSLSDAVFVPPHHKYVAALMSDLEKFLHNDAIQVPALIRIAIAHYQFETIHPFLDGNGRIGRLLIPLFLVDQGVLHKPLLYLSVFFEQNRSLYYDSLTLVRTHNDMAQWIKYFLKGMAETAENATQTLVAVLDLKRRLERELSQSFGKRASAALQLLSYLFVKPTINIKQSEAQLGVSFKSANDLVADFVAAGVLKEMTGQSRNRVFVFDAYLALFRG